MGPFDSPLMDPWVPTRNVHGNGKDRDAMEFQWERENDQPWDGLGLKCGHGTLIGTSR